MYHVFMLNYRCLAFISVSLSHIGPLTGNTEHHIIRSVEFFLKILVVDWDS